jgi:hypothetical protein
LKDSKHQERLNEILDQAIKSGHGTIEQLERSGVKKMFEDFDKNYCKYEEYKKTYKYSMIRNHEVDELWRIYKRKGIDAAIYQIETWLHNWKQSNVV